MPTVIEQKRLGWGDPDSPTYRARHITAVSAAGISVSVRREVAPLFHALIILMGRDYDLDDVRDDWGYANRDIRGATGSRSYHAWGLAVDLNATRNVLGSSTFQFHRERTSRIATNLSLEWGGNWRTRPDAMHFEYRGSLDSVPAAIRRMRLHYPAVGRKVTRG